MSGVLKLAVTGNMGSGKSVVSRMLEIMGVPVYDCDSRAKSLMQYDKSLVLALKRMFGDECYNSDGSLKRSLLAARLQAKPHPAYQNRFCSCRFPLEDTP